MKKMCLPLAFGVLCFASAPARAQQQLAVPPMSNPPVTYGYDLKPQAVFDLDQAGQKFVDLATAIPAEKYSYRPAPGVRSIGEVYLHVTAANYLFLEALSSPAPAKYKAKDWETSITNKDAIIAELRQSFANAHAVMEKVSTTDIAKPMTQFGPEAVEGDLEYGMVTHLHEHLGQSIAYARAVGVTPPWTAAAEAAAKKKAAGGKPADGPKPE